MQKYKKNIKTANSIVFFGFAIFFGCFFLFQTKFAVAAAAAQVAMNDSEQLAQLKAEFMKRRKYLTLRGFIFTDKYAKNA